ncbi:hypothetical protein F190043G2_33790 [Blautia caecimuris]
MGGSKKNEADWKNGADCASSENYYPGILLIKQCAVQKVPHKINKYFETIQTIKTINKSRKGDN